MTVNPVLNPVYLIRSYAWAVLQANDPAVWDSAKYEGLIPIVPVSEEPELTEFTGPHIVYGFALDGTGRLPEEDSGSVTFAIYDQDFRRATKTLNILKAAFGRADESARDINAFTSLVRSDGTVGEGAHPYVGIRFGTVNIGFVEGGTPEETEGGRQSSLINIRFSYFVDYNVITNLV